MSYNTDGAQRDALPDLPRWVDASSPNTWAPDVSQLDDGCFIMYYSASTALIPSRHCVGAATSCNITGPYTPQDTPLFCPLSQGGAIDPAGFDDHGQRYVVYKVDGNSIGHGGECSNTVPPMVPTPIILQAMDPNGSTAIGPAYTLLNNRGILDGGSVEAPSLVQTAAGTYVLYFSSGCFLTENYTVNYATASSITGPYTRANVPLFRTGDYGLVGPGGMTMYHDARHMVFHARWGGDMNRALYVAEIGYRGDVMSDEISTRAQMESNANNLTVVVGLFDGHFGSVKPSALKSAQGVVIAVTIVPVAAGVTDSMGLIEAVLKDPIKHLYRGR